MRLASRHLPRHHALIRAVMPLLLLALLAGCSSPKPFDGWSESATPVHVVRPGDTLYSIAVANNTDYRQLAQWNGIRDPGRIYVGQRIRLSPPAGTTVSRVPPAPTASSPPARSSSPASSPPSRSQPATPPAQSRPATPAVSSGPFAWRWPADGDVLRRFNAADPSRRGIDIGGKMGDPVRAAGDGEVVYAGSGLPGYGNLLIIKHNQRHLSAYAFNQSLLVKEGDRVKAGDRIATMGRDGSRPPALHFQIRVDGQPADPLRFLPPR